MISICYAHSVMSSTVKVDLRVFDSSKLKTNVEGFKSEFKHSKHNCDYIIDKTLFPVPKTFVNPKYSNMQHLLLFLVDAWFVD